MQWVGLRVYSKHFNWVAYCYKKTHLQNFEYFLTLNLRIEIRASELECYIVVQQSKALLKWSSLVHKQEDVWNVGWFEWGAKTCCPNQIFNLQVWLLVHDASFAFRSHSRKVENVYFPLQKLFEEQFPLCRFEIYSSSEKLHAHSLGETGKLVLYYQVVLSKQNFEGVFDDWIVNRIKNQYYLL